MSPSAAALCQRGDELVRLGRCDEAIAVFRQALAAAPRQAPVHLGLGRAYQADGRLAASIVAFRQALSVDARDSAAWRHLGAALDAAGKSDDALAAWRQAIAVNPADDLARTGLGLALLARGQTPAGIESLRQAAAVSTLPRLAAPGSAFEPVEFRRHTLIGFSARQRFEIDLSILVFRRPDGVAVCAPTLLRRATGATEAEALRGLAAVTFTTGTGSTGAAGIGALTVTPATVPDAPEFSYHFGTVLSRSNHLHEALACLQQARQLGFERPDFLFFFGHIHATLGRLDDAVALYRRALDDCLRDNLDPVRYGTPEIPVYLRRPDPPAGVAQLLQEWHALGATPGDCAASSNPPPNDTGESHADDAVLLRLIEVHNLLAENLINEHGDFPHACEVYRRRDRLRRAWLQERGLDQTDTLFLGIDWARNIGHIAYLDHLIRMRELGLAPWRRIVLLVPEERIANPAYLRSWQKFVTIETDPARVARFEPLTTVFGFRFSTLFPFAGQADLFTNEIGSAVEAAWAARDGGPLLSLLPEQDDAGRRGLAALGVPPAAWFVCLHVRETGYHPLPDQAHRNASFSTYAAAIKLITDRGGWVIRLGDATMSRLAATARVIDYPHTALKSPAMDVFLAARCRFMIGMNSGLSHLPYSFGVPVLMVNWTITGPLPPFPRRGIFLPKLIHVTAGDRLLSFREQLAPEWRARSYSARLLAENGARLVDNTPDEISAAVAEMFALLDGPPETTTADKDTRQRFTALLHREAPTGVARPGAAFLRRHQALLN